VQETPHPKVWLDMDQAALDDAYDQPVFAPNFKQVLKRYATNSATTRKRLGEPERFTYGPTPIEQLQLFRASEDNAPLHVHVHGGAWLQQNAGNYAFPAEAFNAAGIHYAVFDFTACDETDGELAPMVEQVRRALAFVVRNAEKLGSRADRIYVSGFSSGAHLASTALITDWRTYDLPEQPFCGALLISGCYDLQPVRLSKRSKYIKFTDAIVADFSAIRHLDRLRTPLLLTHGTFETPEFQRQTRALAQALDDAGRPAHFLLGEGYNHFEMFETMANPFGLLGHAVLAQIKQLV
jgi:arylformamidase